MVDFTNNDYAGANIAVGTFDANEQYSGIQQTDISTHYAFSGSVNGVGDVVSVVRTTNGVSQAAQTYYYEGYYDDDAGTAIYVFSTGLYAGSALAIGSTGGAVDSQPDAVTLIRSGSIPTCFLRGTMIATPDGETAVQDLRAGDRVATRVRGETVFDTVVWVGHRSVRLSNGFATLDDFPVRIRAGAIRDAVPSRDLLVTSEHCLLVDGRLVPARMLVNRTSILVDTAITQFEYFHVELERHAILIADGMEAESYLDTGNRAGFVNAAVPDLHRSAAKDADRKAWATHAAAPLATDRETVEPIWARLSARADAMGLSAAVPVTIDNDPDLRLLTATGVEIRPTLRDGSVYAFVVPRQAGHLRLLSRRFRPCDSVGPFVDDRRTLGVLVGRIGVSDGRGRLVCEAHLAGEPLDGWHDVEANARWTTGDAALPVDVDAIRAATLCLDIEILVAGPYFAEAGRIAA